MTSEGTQSEQRVVNPICGYHVEGVLDDPESYAVVVELHGEAGERSTVTLDRSELVESLSELLLRAADDLAFAEEYGLGALVEQVGTDETDPLTVDDILRAAASDPDA